MDLEGRGVDFDAHADSGATRLPRSVAYFVYEISSSHGSWLSEFMPRGARFGRHPCELLRSAEPVGFCLQHPVTWYRGQLHAAHRRYVLTKGSEQ